MLERIFRFDKFRARVDGSIHLDRLPICQTISIDNISYIIDRIEEEK